MPFVTDDFSSYFPSDEESMVVPPNPFLRYPTNYAIQGSLVFYIKRRQHEHINSAIRRGPIYSRSSIEHSRPANVFATEASYIGVKDGEGFVQDVELCIVGMGGVFVIKLLGKELYVVETDGEIFVKRVRRDEATIFKVEPQRGGLMIPMTWKGSRWQEDEHGHWNTNGRGKPLLVKFWTEEQKSECSNPWGKWQAPYQYEWPL